MRQTVLYLLYENENVKSDGSNQKNILKFRALAGVQPYQTNMKHLLQWYLQNPNLIIRFK